MNLASSHGNCLTRVACPCVMSTLSSFMACKRSIISGSVSFGPGIVCWLVRAERNGKSRVCSSNKKRNVVVLPSQLATDAHACTHTHHFGRVIPRFLALTLQDSWFTNASKQYHIFKITVNTSSSMPHLGSGLARTAVDQPMALARCRIAKESHA